MTLESGHSGLIVFYMGLCELQNDLRSVGHVHGRVVFAQNVQIALSLNATFFIPKFSSTYVTQTTELNDATICNVFLFFWLSSLI